MSTELVQDDGEIVETTALVREGDWDGAAARGLRAREEREQIIKKVLRAGSDFGVIPGTTKPTLLKPGAEKVADSLNLYPEYEALGVTEDWSKPLFVYRYRCRLKQRGTDNVVATGIASCNSMENRYRWRNGERLCPKCGKPCIIKGKEEYGGGFICFTKKGGCGAKFGDNDQTITGQTVGKVENDDIYTQVNSIDKMAQKRAMIAAVLNLGFSDQFTQDMEDREPEQPQPRAKANGKPPATEPKEASDLWKNWDKILDVEVLNEKNFNDKVLTLFKAIPGQHPDRTRIWARIKKFAAGLDMFMLHGSKEFVKQVHDPE